MDWWNVAERAFWTALQVPAVLGVLDLIELGQVPSSAYWRAALFGFFVSALKTVGTERLKRLDY